MNRQSLKAVAVLVVLAVAYFAVYPEDLEVLAPFERLLRLTEDISAWLYLLVAVLIVCRTIERVWGRGTGNRG
jgi:hypothetical protein